MNILIRNADSVVIYAQQDLVLSDEGTHGGDWFSPHFTTSNATILEGVDLPDNWVGGVWRYDGAWSVADTARYSQIVADGAARVQAAVIAATQLRLDTFAQTRNYDGILSACTYATSGVTKFAAEGQYCVDARDATWATLYTIMGEVLAQTRPMPESFADVAPLLPALAWPA